jgi:membrane protease YdiL (CAAX protease family)
VSYVSYLLRRFAFAVFSVYAAASVMFGFTVLQARLILQKQLALMRYNGAQDWRIEQFRKEFLARRGLDRPLYEHYADWFVDLTTLEWGQSIAYDQSVAAVLDGRVVTTLEYVVPGVVVAVALVASEVGFVVVGYAFRRTDDGRDLVVDWLGRPGARDVALIVGTTAVLVVFNRIAFAVGSLLGIDPATAVSTPEELSVAVLAFVIPAMLFAVGPAEEYLFRGVIQGYLRQSFSARGAIGWSAVLFTLVHLPNLLANPESGVVSIPVWLGIGLVLGWRNHERVEAAVVNLGARAGRLAGEYVPRVADPGREAIETRVSHFFEAIERVATNPRGLVLALLFSALGWALQMSGLWLAFQAIGEPVSLAAVMFVVPIGAIAGMTPLPGGAGGIEAVLVFLLVAAPLPGVTESVALAAVVIYRGAVFWVPIAIGGVVMGTVGAGARAGA